MKKAVKRIVIAIVALVLIVALAVLVYMWPMFSMSPAPTGPVGETGVLAALNMRNSVYILPVEDGYIAVDAGSNANAAAEELATLGIDPLEVKHVLLTHTDSDHVGALSLFASADIYMSADEMQMVDGTTRRNILGGNSLPAEVQQRLVLVPPMETITLGGHTVTGVSAPGHTPGSMAFIVDETMLFTGDALRVQDGALLVHPYTMDKAEAEATIKGLQALAGEYVFTAHYGCFRADDLPQE